MARSRDVSAIAKMIVQSRRLPPAEYINRTVGSLVYFYYSYYDTFKSPPRTLDELVDGILYLEARNYTQKYELGNK